MKIYVNRQPRTGPWGGGAKWVNAFYDVVPTLGHQIVTINDKPDVLFIVGMDQEETGDISLEQAVMYKQYASRFGEKIQLIQRINENDARKNTNHVDVRLLQASKHIDTTVFVSHWLQEYFVTKGWQNTDTNVIYNGVDAEIFKPGQKLDNGKVNIVCAHWSDHALKGQWLNEELDGFVGENPDFTFTFIGRTKAILKNSTHIQPVPEKELGQLLGTFDVCVSASVSDPGPNHALEAISCGLPFYAHKDGGGTCEFAGPSHVYQDWSELKSILLSKKFEKNSTSFGSWKRCIERFVSCIE